MTASSIGEETTMATGYDETGTSKTHLWMALRALLHSVIQAGPPSL